MVSVGVLIPEIGVMTEPPSELPNSVVSPPNSHRRRRG